MSYADRRRQPALRQPRNMVAVDRARQQDLTLIVSFVGDTPWPLTPTIYCDPGKVYDWTFLEGLPQHTVIVVKDGTDIKNALPKILEQANTIKVGYPVLVDVESKQLACVVEGPDGAKLWHVVPGGELWQQYFSPAL